MSLSQSTRVEELEQQLAQAEADGEKMAARIAEIEARLAAAEHMIAHAKHGYIEGRWGVNPAFCRSDLDDRWIAYWPSALAMLDADGEPRRFDDWYDAYKAAVEAGWSRKVAPPPQSG